MFSTLLIFSSMFLFPIDCCYNHNFLYINIYDWNVSVVLYNPSDTWPEQWTIQLCDIFVLIQPPVPQTPQPRHPIQFTQYLPPFLTQVGTPPQNLLDQLLLQPEKQPPLQRISIEVIHLQQPPYLYPPLKVYTSHQLSVLNPP